MDQFFAKYQQRVHMHAEQPLRVLVVGECGDGKSTLVNNLLGLDGEAAASAGLEPGGITKNINEYRSDIYIGGRQLVVLDSPGVGDENVTAMQLLSMTEEHLSSLRGEMLDCVIVTSPCGAGRVRLGAQVVKTLVDKGFVGPEKWQNIILVGTKMDEANDVTRSFFLDRLAPKFFSASEGNPGQAVMTSLTDVSQLLKALEVSPRTKVQYEKPDAEIMSKALAKELGINEKVFQENLKEERTRREQAVLAAREAKAAAEKDCRLREKAELEEQQAKAAAEKQRRLREQAVLEEQKAKAAAAEERRLKEAAKARAEQQRRLKEYAEVQRQLAEEAARQARAAEQRERAAAQRERAVAQRERELRQAAQDKAEQREMARRQQMKRELQRKWDQEVRDYQEERRKSWDFM